MEWTVREHRGVHRQTDRHAGLCPYQLSKGTEVSAVFLAISSILTFLSIATLAVWETKSCPDPLAQHRPVLELLPAGIYVGSMLMAMQPLAVLTAGCITVFILMTATSHQILLRHRVAPGLRAEKQLSHHDYGQTCPSASQGCWAALVPLCQAGEARVTPRHPIVLGVHAGASPPPHSRVVLWP